MRGLLWCLYAVAAVSGATITTTATSRISTTVTTTKLSTVTTKAVSTVTVTSKAVSTVTVKSGVTVISTQLSTTTAPASTVYVTLPASTVSVTTTSIGTISKTTTLPASTTTLPASTITLPASTSYVTRPASTTTLPASTTTLPASYVTLPASTVTISASTSYVTLPASTALSTVTASASYVTLPASTVTVSASTSYVTLPASTALSTVTASASYVTLSASTVLSTVTAPISYTTAFSTLPASTVYITITASGTGSSNSTRSPSSMPSTASSTSSTSATSTTSSTSTASSTSSTSVTSTTSSASTHSTTPITRTATPAPAATPSGTISTCYQWHIANSWDTCVLLEGEFGISAANLLAWNPNINSACSNIIAGDAYCVDGSGNLFTSPTITASSAVVTGIISPCYRYHIITSGDYCSLLQLEFGISFDVLRAWNPSIDNACDNLVVGDSYCVDGAGHNVLPSTVYPSTPTSSGTATTCYQYYIVTSSDTCTSIETSFGLTFDLLRVWNTQISNKCDNLQVGYSLCVDGTGLFTSALTGSSSSTTSTTTLNTIGKPVFAHYMVGTMTSAEAVIDIQQAQSMGIDAFALNIGTTTESWSINATAALFAAAQSAGFKLFFSFDMTKFSVPSDFIPLLQNFTTNSAYYQYNNLPFVSTFNGGTTSFGYRSPNEGWQTAYKNVMSAAGISTYFVPDFDDASVSPSNMYSNFPVADGLFHWEGSWPTVGQGKVNVSSTDDASYITAAKTAGKTFMMGISAIQFKHMSSSSNWLRRGGLNLALRISQILTLNPDFVEIQTWNDAGESHYIGPVWNESIAGSSIGSYTAGYDHSGWQILMTSMLKAYKAGYTSISNVVPTGSATVQGVFWHSTLLSTASCSSDPFGKPSGSWNLDDSVAVAVLVAKDITGLTVNVYSGGTKIGSYATVQGLNAFEVFGMGVGAVKVEVLSSSGSTILNATGSIAVQADSSNCNYNPQVVALS